MAQSASANASSGSTNSHQTLMQGRNNALATGNQARLAYGLQAYHAKQRMAGKQSRQPFSVCYSLFILKEGKWIAFSDLTKETTFDLNSKMSDIMEKIVDECRASWNSKQSIPLKRFAHILSFTTLAAHWLLAYCQFNLIHIFLE